MHSSIVVVAENKERRKTFIFPKLKKWKSFAGIRREPSQPRRRHRDDIINRRDMPPKGPQKQEVE